LLLLYFFSYFRSSFPPSQPAQYLETTSVLDIRNAFKHPMEIVSVVPSILTNRNIFSNTRRIGGLLTWRVGLSLYNAVMESNHPSSNVVEVGVFQGLSTSYLAYASKKKGKKVKSFDWFQGLSQPNPDLDHKRFIQGTCLSNEEVFDRNLKALGLREVVDLTVGDARLTLLPAIKDTGFSVAFLDVDIFDVTRDLLGQLKTVIHGGETIFIHDYDSPGIIKAVDEFMGSFDGNIESSVIDKGRLMPAIKLKIL
jgi:hypothetical protein